MNAIIKTGGKQYRVEEGQILKVEKIPATKGDIIEFTDVLSIADEQGVKFGRPFLEGAKVKAEVIEQGKGDKVIIFKFKAKKRYRRKKGHRQPFTKVLIDKIEA